MLVACAPQHCSSFEKYCHNRQISVFKDSPEHYGYSVELSGRGDFSENALVIGEEACWEI